MKSDALVDIATEEVLTLDRARVAAVNRNDFSALEVIFSEDLVHVHATGRIDDRDGVLQNFRENPRTIESRTPGVRIYGDTAVLMGRQVSVSKDMISDLFVTQVACRQARGWRFVSFHACKAENSASLPS